MTLIRLLCVAMSLPCLLVGGEPTLRNDKEALAPLQQYVGDWRGVGQIRRGSAQGAWREQSAWIWKFADGGAMLSFSISGAKYFENGNLRPAGSPDSYVLVASTAEGDKTRYVGKLAQDGRLVLVAEEPPAGAPVRISIRQVARGDRLVILYEKRTNSGRFARLAEVGYTRKGSNFGKGTNYVECVVTGGLGTIPVMHAGKTYYVCCTGCRDYFNENAEEVLAEYRQRKSAGEAK